MPDKIKRFIDCYVPVTTCNLRCHYCYITQQRKFSDKLPEFKYSPKYIAQALSKERLGGLCCLNFCGGGETLLPPEMPNIIFELLKQGHYVMVVTNGTVSKRFDEIIAFPEELLKRLFFKFSFHFLELKRTNQMTKFCANVNKVRKAGCSISVEITPNDELIPYIDEIKSMSMENFGAFPHITVARDNTKAELPILTNFTREEYKNVWSSFDSDLFKYKIQVFNEKRTEFCYAGVWSYALNIGTGELKQCYQGKLIQNIYQDIKSSIIEIPVGYHCPESHCYNAHAFLTFGDIPEHTCPNYLAMRDRITKDGEHWVKEPIRTFFCSKLNKTNKEYNVLLKLKNKFINTKRI